MIYLEKDGGNYEISLFVKAKGKKGVKAWCFNCRNAAIIHNKEDLIVTAILEPESVILEGRKENNNELDYYYLTDNHIKTRLKHVLIKNLDDTNWKTIRLGGKKVAPYILVEKKSNMISLCAPIRKIREKYKTRFTLCLT